MLQGCYLIVKLSEVKTRLQNRIPASVRAVWRQVLNGVHEAEASLTNLTTNAVLVHEDGSLERADPFNCTDVTVELHNTSV